MQDLPEIQGVYDEGRDSGNIDVELLRRRSNPASPPTLSLSFASDGIEDRGDPEDDWWLGWALKRVSRDKEVCRLETNFG
jgi:hypothetical protein